MNTNFLIDKTIDLNKDNKNALIYTPVGLQIVQKKVIESPEIHLPDNYKQIAQIKEKSTKPVKKIFIPLIKLDYLKNSSFSLEIFIEDLYDQFFEPIQLNQFLNEYKQSETKRLLQELFILSEYLPCIKELIFSPETQMLTISSEDFGKVFFESLPPLKNIGIKILFPRDLYEVLVPNLKLIAKKKSQGIKAYFSLSQILEFDWEISLGENKLSPNDFLELIEKSKGIVKIKDQFVYLADREVKKILKAIKSPPKLNTGESLKAILAENHNDTKVVFNQNTRNLIESLLQIKEIPLPRALKATLRDYQKKGYDWLYKNFKLGFGSLIADDMGLGKTLQVITLLLKMKELKSFKEKPALVIVPTSLLTNWQKEIEKFAPSLKIAIYHGAGRKLNTKDIDILITTYGLIRSEKNKFAWREWAAIIIDEAQNIKNHGTEQTQAVKVLKSPIRIAMTGTPIENSLTEYWSIFDFINKGYLGNLQQFKEKFVYAIESKKRDAGKLEAFRQITSPFVLRRLKSEVKDLPEKIELDKYCALTEGQIALYQNTLNRFMINIEKASGLEKAALILRLITSLKQICNHPAHFLKKKNLSSHLSGKTILLFELLEEILKGNEKTLIFTQFAEMGYLLQKLLKQELKISTLFFYGKLNRMERDQIIDKFQNDKEQKILILSLKAGGTGLNLMQANHVIHYDLWWNPAVEAQATDRAYRIGQQKNVMVYRFISQGTFEEKINQLSADKKELANLVTNSGDAWLGDLSITDLQNLFKLD